MTERINWEEAYRIWKYGTYNFPEDLSAPVAVEPVFVEYDRPGYFFGYDWLSREEARERKELIARDPKVFLYFTQPSNKGTIRTAEMLAGAQTAEDRAALWIAATARELRERDCGKGVRKYAMELYDAACDFLRGRWPLWHHAMRGLVPQVVVPTEVLTSISCEDAAPVMGLIRLNTAILRNTYCILQYTSLKEGELPPSC